MKEQEEQLREELKRKNVLNIFVVCSTLNVTFS